MSGRDMHNRELSFCVKIVLYREEEMWIAHCLEFDVIGSGETQSEAVCDLTVAMQIQIEQSVKHNNVRNLFRPADSDVYAMFAAGRAAKMNAGEVIVTFEFENVHIPSCEAREFENGDDAENGSRQLQYA